MKINHVTVSKVKKMLKSLSNSRSTGIDELDNFSVKLSAELIAQPVHHIITLSIMQSKFPNGWKYSKVLPLHKKEDILERKNYRPVAILSPLSKISMVIEKSQSNQTALLQMYDRWVRSASDGQHCGGGST